MSVIKDEVDSRAEKVQEEQWLIADMLCVDRVDISWAEVVLRNKKVEKKSRSSKSFCPGKEGYWYKGWSLPGIE